ncbi:VOC family protein [Pararhodobacter zhoushanensis]|uniref:VOC family protein n=1 Tax=Pararhodobacter zhoushanensis TaxID=2479545 RepID=A0ABT3GWH1_9RHOB|nr:VOC family protein [Pararhodobacter zhoushanensis]MCW1931889.1 VOC family protein [Pararhodobacter zhoushanensis]
MVTTLEHTNLTVTDALATAAWMASVFGWHTRWQGPSIHSGFSVHVGSDDSYLALYQPKTPPARNAAGSYATIGGLNHIAVTVSDLDATEALVRAQGFAPHSHADYEPGRRFYFNDSDGVEYEVVSYS